MAMEIAGSCSDVQRTVNVHAHVLAVDGVYVADGPGGTLAFHALPAPTRADVTEVARRTPARVARILQVHGRSFDPDGHLDPHPVSVDDPALAAYYAAAAQGISVARERLGKPTLRLVVADAGIADGRTRDFGVHRHFRVRPPTGYALTKRHARPRPPVPPLTSQLPSRTTGFKLRFSWGPPGGTVESCDDN
jgi:hypothetical protein